MTKLSDVMTEDQKKLVGKGLLKSHVSKIGSYVVRDIKTNLEGRGATPRLAIENLYAAGQ